MVFERLVGDGGQFPAKFLDAGGPVDRSALPVAEDKVTETELVLDEILYLPRQREGVLVDEAGVDFLGPFLVLDLVTLQQAGDTVVERLHVTDQADARILVFHPVSGVADVGDNADDVVAILVDDGHGVLVGADEYQFRPRTHPQDQGGLVVAGFAVDDGLCLGHDLGVEEGEVAGIVLDRVLDHEDHPHVAEPGVGLEVDFVLQVLGHG